MPARALIVLLLVLNLGVASWWLLRTPPVEPIPAAPAGVPTLRLLREPSTSVPSQRGPRPIAPPVVVALPGDAQCVRFGPYGALARDAVRQQLASRVLRAVPRDAAAAPARGWSVLVPRLPSLDAAQALAQRITAAGFNDLMVIREGEQANAIALGRYDGKDAAERRVAALVAAGFPARAEPIGDATMLHWLDVALAAGSDPAGLHDIAGVPQPQPLDCATLQ